MKRKTIRLFNNLLCLFFGHRYRLKRRITNEIEEVLCIRCKRDFAIHHGEQVLLPLDEELRKFNDDIFNNEYIIF